MPAQLGELGCTHEPGVEVREEPGLSKHGLGHLAEIGEGGRMAQPLQLLSRDAVAALGLIAQGEEGLLRSEEHTSELQSREKLVCRLLLEKKKQDPERPAC